MKLSALIVAASAAWASPTEAQMMTIMSDGTMQGDWTEVLKCASQPYPERPKGDITSSNIGAHTEFERQWQTISWCRLAIAARHNGWAAATDKPDPYAPNWSGK